VKLDGFTEAEKHAGRSITRCCRLFEVSRAAYYQRRNPAPSPRQQSDARYVGDITYIATWEGWAYLATVIDLATRRIVGWALAEHMRTELVTDALEMAFTQRRRPQG
jgi:transposase InsO family protein